MMFTELSTLNQINPPTIIVSLKKKTETNKDRLQNQILNRLSISINKSIKTLIMVSAPTLSCTYKYFDGCYDTLWKENHLRKTSKS